MNAETGRRSSAGVGPPIRGELVGSDVRAKAVQLHEMRGCEKKEFRSSAGLLDDGKVVHRITALRVSKTRVATAGERVKTRAGKSEHIERNVGEQSDDPAAIITRPPR